jgi:shikimate 5-dehydrogenase
MEMYLNQAAMQSTLFAGRKPAIAAMRRILAPYIH